MRQEKGGEEEVAGTGVIRDRGRETVVDREEKWEVTEAEKKCQGQNSVCG